MLRSNQVHAIRSVAKTTPLLFRPRCRPYELPKLACLLTLNKFKTNFSARAESIAIRGLVFVPIRIVSTLYWSYAEIGNGNYINSSNYTYSSFPLVSAKSNLTVRCNKLVTIFQRNTLASFFYRFNPIFFSYSVAQKFPNSYALSAALDEIIFFFARDLFFLFFPTKFNC